MHRSLLGILAASLLFTVTACREDGEGSGRKSGSTADNNDGPAGMLSEEDLQAKVVAGAPPKDLAWVVPEAPAGWRELTTEAGTRQWQVGASRCIVTVNQPAGLGNEKTPTSEDVAKDYIELSLKQANATARFDPPSQQLFANTVNSEEVEVRSEFTGIHFTGDPGDIEGQAYGYRAGEFALRALALCGGGEYVGRSTELEEFLRSLTARTTY